MHDQHHTANKRQCIDTIAPKNNWIVRIGNSYLNLEYLRSELVWNRETLPYYHEEWPSYGASLLSEVPNPIERSLFNIIEEEPNQCFDFIQSNCLQNEALIMRLAMFLSGRAVEQLWNRIFSKENVDEQFVARCYTSFFWVFLARPYTWFSLHLLIKASKAYPVYFRSTIKMLLKDALITSTILQDYVNHISLEDCNNLMKLVTTELALTPLEFGHIIPVLYTMYKKCTKTANITLYILSNLESGCELFSYDVNYGRLLRYFVQINLTEPQMRSRLQRLVDNHYTVYQSLCSAIIMNYDAQIMAIQMEWFHDQVVVIPKIEETTIGI